ncbi:MAG TPA: hypothetical protein VMB77_06660 [Syntrophales bacterium]|nr:hypothetical protein [Syntrophales bacterium]
MKRILLILILSTGVVLMALPAWGQERQGMMGRGMMGDAYGMGPGMMSSPYWLTVPEKILPPKNTEWVTKLQEDGSKDDELGLLISLTWRSEIITHSSLCPSASFRM